MNNFINRLGIYDAIWFDDAVEFKVEVLCIDKQTNTAFAKRINCDEEEVQIFVLDCETGDQDYEFTVNEEIIMTLNVEKFKEEMRG